MRDVYTNTPEQAAMFERHHHGGYRDGPDRADWDDGPDDEHEELVPVDAGPPPIPPPPDEEPT